MNNKSHLFAWSVSLFKPLYFFWVYSPEFEIHELYGKKKNQKKKSMYINIQKHTHTLVSYSYARLSPKIA